MRLTGCDFMKALSALISLSDEESFVKQCISRQGHLTAFSCALQIFIAVGFCT